MDLNTQKLNVIWRLAVLAVLAWIAVELHFIREEMPSTWSVESSLNSIESTGSEVNQTAEKILRFMPTR